jgi:hypothetical protein
MGRTRTNYGIAFSEHSRVRERILFFLDPQSRKLIRGASSKNSTNNNIKDSHNSWPLNSVLVGSLKKSHLYSVHGSLIYSFLMIKIRFLKYQS